MRLALSAAAALLLLACGGGRSRAPHGPTPEPTSRASAPACAVGVDPRITDLGAAFLRSPQAVGVSIGVVHRGAAECYDFGRASKATGAPITEQTLYEIGSLTKTFTSVLLAQAVREGKLRLDDDIRRHLPEPYPNLEYEGNPIRVVHLANLTSGLPNWLPDRPELFRDLAPEAIPAAIVALHRDYGRAEFYRDLHQVRLAAAPGTRPAHSNAAAQLLALILEHVHGAPFEALVKQRITAPLGMDRTGFHADPLPADLARGHDATGAEMPYIDMQDVQSSGGLLSSTADMLRFVAYQLDESDEVVAQGHRVTVTAADDAVGLHWHVDTGPDGTRTIWHTGGTFGFSSYLVLYPERQLGLVLLANESDPEAQTRLVELAGHIAQRLAEPRSSP
ncbi:serine hydrolase domain-containing protein [Nannocystis sp. SCPEA4]|uniref:serine hydrolase domain-containing protein n=1 Tax=Nannocystis sp. SCPEA4 TaxID=2996787 RepID=UPI0022710A9A|nr:serine hydrolase domain-containing protein [Nannocystis sp. SCPEA4]MCY1057584.1 serine hydrolase [Nannocystis sp. SCPEA4]